jgi:hypothetical protein
MCSDTIAFSPNLTVLFVVAEDLRNRRHEQEPSCGHNQTCCCDRTRTLCTGTSARNIGGIPSGWIRWATYVRWTWRTWALCLRTATGKGTFLTPSTSSLVGLLGAEKHQDECSFILGLPIQIVQHWRQKVAVCANWIGKGVSARSVPHPTWRVHGNGGVQESRREMCLSRAF